MPDHDGTELRNAQEARKKAVILAGNLIAEKPETFVDGHQWHVEVADEQGMILFRLDFMATDTPATKVSNGASLSFRSS